jgi:hypothetical protein
MVIFDRASPYLSIVQLIHFFNMAIFDYASPYLSIVQFIHFLIWLYLTVPNLVRKSIHSFKEIHGGGEKRKLKKTWGAKSKGYSFGTRVCG